MLSSSSTMVQKQILEQIYQILEAAVNSTSSQSQKNVYDLLSAAEQNVQFYIGLATIACNKQIQLKIRQMALITLKSSLKRNQQHIQFTNEQLNCFKNFIIAEQYEENDGKNSIMSKTQKSLISVLALWNNRVDYEILDYIIKCINNQNSESRCVWALDTLTTILQDVKFETQNVNCFHQEQFIKFTQVFISIFSQRIGSSSIVLTSYLLTCMNHLLKYANNNNNQAVHQYLNNYLISALKSCMTDRTLANSAQSDGKNKAKSIVQVVLDGINEVISIDSRAVIRTQAAMNAIIHFSLQNYQEKIAKKWLSIILDLLQADNEQQRFKPYLKTVTQKIVPCLQFSQQDLLNVKMETQQQNNPYEYQEESNDDSFEDAKGYYTYTKRRLSVMILEKLFLNYAQQQWNILSPYLNHCLNSADLKQRQCGVLMIGIIYEKIQDHLDYLQIAIPIVVSHINNQQLPSLLRCTSLWAIGKISYLIVRQQSLNQKIQNQLLICLRNSPHQICDAAYSTFDQLINVSQKLPEKLQEIIQCIINGIKVCKGKPLYSVLKTCSEIYSRFSSNIPQQITSHIIVNLCTKWGANSQIQSIMSPILQLLTTISSVSKQTFITFAFEIFKQTFKVLEQQHQKAIILRAIDLLSSIIGINQQQVTQILTEHEQFHKKLNFLLKSEQNQIKNFTYGLLGDISKITSFPKFAQVHFQTIFNSYNRKNLTSSSNALTCLTDIIVSHPFLAAKYSQVIMVLTLQNLNTQNIHQAHAFNFARIYGRLSNINPAEGSKFIRQNLRKVCQSLKTHQPQKLTDQTYRGIFKTIQYDPKQAIGCFQYVVEKFICYNALDKQLQRTFLNILKSFRRSLTNQQWNVFITKPIFLPAVSKKLQAISI